MICHHYKCIFVHIPKNAGQSIEHVFLDLLGLTWETRAPLLLRYNDRPELGPPRLAHLKAHEYVKFNYLPQQMFDEYFKFAFVRNPWSRMVSIYKYFGYDKETDFKSFLMGEFKDKIFHNKYWFVGPQSAFIYSDDGKLLVDYVGRFENLQSDFDFVCKKVGISPTSIPHINDSGHRSFNQGLTSNPKKFIKKLLRIYKVKNIPSFRNYKEYYDNDSIDCVAQLYKKDIELFGYNFE